MISKATSMLAAASLTLGLMLGLTLMGAPTAALAQAEGLGEAAVFMHAMPPNSLQAPGRGSNRFASGNPPETSEGAALLKKAGVACTAVDGALVTSSGRGVSYEVACRDDFGWLVAKTPDGEVTAIDCLTIAGSTHGLRHCNLRANRVQTAGLQKIVDAAKQTCTVTDGMWQGSGGKPPITRYEATCKEGSGFILDITQPEVKPREITATACKDAPSFGLKCSMSKG